MNLIIYHENTNQKFQLKQMMSLRKGMIQET